jgi:hypothetical protein
MLFDMGAFHEKCAKSFLGSAGEHSELAKCHMRLANKAAGDHNREIANCHDRLSDHYADLADHHARAAKALGGITTHDDSYGTDSLAQAAIAGKFGMVKAMEDEKIWAAVAPPQKPDPPDPSNVPPELADIFRS